ncbi:NAD(P)-binding protein [Parathielavia appendiculata]|uniref:NAD(P)-binding protein n=1 Tax=Parathielavia appendiculata TaxID=2587402 RepID=A0AAN6U5U1_9PEZI|nr:NAD(P)-binding protein [Parathielavia appendiculata]
MAEALAEAGGKVYTLDREPSPGEYWQEAIARFDHSTAGSLHYRQADVSKTPYLYSLIASIGAEHQRLDGVVAAAGIQQVTPALDYSPSDVARMLEIHYTGVFMTAQSAVKQMFKYKTRGSICLIASMSGLIANKGLLSPVYNSLKAALDPISEESGDGVESYEGGRIRRHQDNVTLRSLAGDPPY